MATRLPLPECKTLEAFELECNALLASLGWGTAHVYVTTERKRIRIEHTDLPKVGSLGTPSGYVLATAIKGLYDGWLQQIIDERDTISTTYLPELTFTEHDKRNCIIFEARMAAT